MEMSLSALWIVNAGRSDADADADAESRAQRIYRTGGKIVVILRFKKCVTRSPLSNLKVNPPRVPLLMLVIFGRAV